MTELPPMTRRQLRKPKRGRILLITSLVLVLAIAVGYVNRSAMRGTLDIITGQEYSGSGSGQVSFTIKSGESGATIAKHLAEQGITKTYSSTLRHVNAANPTFFPGTYSLPKEIGSDKAISLITGGGSLVSNQVTIPEGLRLVDIYQRLSDKTGISVNAFKAAGDDLSYFGIPRTAPSLEGYLFPATYSFDPDLKPKEILLTMVHRMKQELVSLGIKRKDWQDTLTLASIIQREARIHDDFYKVARVFKNRLAVNMPLQSCATASYGVGKFSIIVTNKILNDDNPYNTYKYPGLPKGPISAPGSLALDAALHPAEGKWLYFVTWNLSTGETIFSETYAQHLAGVAKWDKWMAENPGWNG